MTQQHQTQWTPDGPLLPNPGRPPAKRNRLAVAAFVLLALIAVSVIGVALWATDGLAPTTPTSTTHTVEYQAAADAAYGSGRTGMVTAQAPGGTTQKTGLLPITGTYTFSTGDVVYLSVQNGQGLGSVTCRITVDGVVVSENTSDGGYTIATCQGRVSR